MKAPHVYSLFDCPEDPGIDASEGLGADQSFKDDCDINVIMARAERTGELPGLKSFGEYLDLSNAPESFLEARTLVMDAETRFSELPAKVRSKFANDPYSLLSWLADPNNRSEAVQLGLVRAPAEPVVPEPKGEDRPPEGAVAQ